MNLSSAHIHGIISFPLPIKKGVRVRVTIVKQASIMEKFTFFLVTDKDDTSNGEETASSREVCPARWGQRWKY